MGRHKSSLYRCHYYEESTVVNDRNEQISVVSCRMDECKHEWRVDMNKRVQTSQLEAHMKARHKDAW
jgi:hypothetical protein